MVSPIVGDIVKSAYTFTAIGEFKVGKYVIHKGWEGVVVLVNEHEMLVQFQSLHCGMGCGQVLNVWIDVMHCDRIVITKRHLFGKKTILGRKDLKLRRDCPTMRLRYIFSLQKAFLRVAQWVDKKVTMKYTLSSVCSLGERHMIATPKSKRIRLSVDWQDR